MAQIIKPENSRIGVAHILEKHIEDYQAQYPLWPEHRKIVFDLLNCRTAYLGGHIDRCDSCGTLRVTYHSCRNRHCPRCQHMPRERWLAKRKDEILATSYFHVVFTLPHELNTIILNNKKVMLNILFKAASRTLLTFGENEMGGQLGFIATLHTWDQQLKAHFHLHCLVAGGVFVKDSLAWKSCKGNYLFNKEAIGLVFRGKFMNLMGKACQKEALKLDAEGYQKLKSRLYAKKWIIDVRDPVKNPEHVLEYLARYTHRVAIANSRITKLEDGMVTFKVKNRKKDRTEHLTITAVEFIRRFLMHSLPKRFVRIRHYGFLANRYRTENLNIIRHLMDLRVPAEQASALVEDMMLKLTGVDITVCPCCHKGNMQLVQEIPKYLARPPNPLSFRAA